MTSNDYEVFMLTTLYVYTCTFIHYDGSKKEKNSNNDINVLIM